MKLKEFVCLFGFVAFIFLCSCKENNKKHNKITKNIPSQTHCLKLEDSLKIKNFIFEGFKSDFKSSNNPDLDLTALLQVKKLVTEDKKDYTVSYSENEYYEYKNCKSVSISFLFSELLFDGEENHLVEYATIIILLNKNGKITIEKVTVAG